MTRHDLTRIFAYRLTADAYRRLLICCAAMLTVGTVAACIAISLKYPQQTTGSALLLTVPLQRRDRQWDVPAQPATEKPSESATEDPDFIPEGAKPVKTLTMIPSSSSEHYGNVYIHNEAGRKYDAEQLLEEPPDIKISTSGEVQVLIYHTHGTEGYNDEGKGYYGDGFYKTRSKDTSDNVVHVGDILAEELEKHGIGVLHDRTMYDDPKYTGAYLLSGAAVKENLEKYPSIVLVIDLHRDTIITSAGTKYRPVTDTEYGQTAQIMLISAAGKTADPNPRWKENLRTALALQKSAAELYPGLMRPLLMRNSMYNQHLSTGAFLAEIGTCGNTMTEAENAAKCLAKAIIEAFS